MISMITLGFAKYVRIESPEWSKLESDIEVRGIVKKYGKAPNRYGQNTYRWKKGWFDDAKMKAFGTKWHVRSD